MDAPKTFSFESMGTSWSVTVWDDLSPHALEEVEVKVVSFCDEFDATYSRFKKNSLVWQIAKKAGIYEVPHDFVRILREYAKLNKETFGKINPLIGFTLSDLGYDAEYTLLKKDNVRRTPNFAEVLTIVDDTHISVSESTLIDIGALGKGFAVDAIKGLLEGVGIQRFLVNGSGDIFYKGDEPLTVGLENPFNETQAIGTYTLTEGAFCASAVNRRAWGEHHHVVDPDTSTSPQTIVATWVGAESAMRADGVASALFFVSPEIFEKEGIDYVVVNSEGNVKRSSSSHFTLF